MNRDYISNTTIEINAPISKVWNAPVTPEIAKEYFFGANIESNWEENSPNTFNGEYNGKNRSVLINFGVEFCQQLNRLRKK